MSFNCQNLNSMTCWNVFVMLFTRFIIVQKKIEKFELFFLAFFLAKKNSKKISFPQKNNLTETNQNLLFFFGFSTKCVFQKRGTKNDSFQKGLNLCTKFEFINDLFKRRASYHFKDRYFEIFKHSSFLNYWQNCILNQNLSCDI